MIKNSVLVFVLLCLVSVSTSMAQDKIFRKNGDTLLVNITEVLTDAVKYRIFNEADGPLYSLDKQRILKIVYESGREETFSSDLRDPELYADQKKRGLKINFLSPLFGYTQFTYEQNVKPGRGWEATLGIIGLGKNPDLDYFESNEKVDARGFFLGGGYKFTKMPNFVKKGERFWHVLHGSYVKPNVFLGFYSRNVALNNPSAEVERKDVQFGGILINLGKQWVLGDVMLLDLYGGFGYAFDNIDYDDFSDSYDNYHYAILSGGESDFGLTAGIKLGILLK